MKTARLLLLNLAAAAFVCLPAASAHAVTPQQHDQNQNNDRRQDNHQGQANHERGNQNHQAQQNTRAEHNRTQNNGNRARPAENRNYAQQERTQRNQQHSARNRGNEHVPSYSFGTAGRQRLRLDYNRTNYRHEVNAHNRARLYRGGYLPNGWRARVHRLPPEYLREVPPPPPGYFIGYYDGFAVVYDPNTGLILQFADVF